MHLSKEMKSKAKQIKQTNQNKRNQNWNALYDKTFLGDWCMFILKKFLYARRPASRLWGKLCVIIKPHISLACASQPVFSDIEPLCGESAQQTSHYPRGQLSLSSTPPPPLSLALARFPHVTRRPRVNVCVRARACVHVCMCYVCVRVRVRVRVCVKCRKCNERERRERERERERQTDRGRERERERGGGGGGRDFCLEDDSFRPWSNLPTGLR